MSWGTVLLLVFGGALALEGLGWAIAPDGMKRAYEEAMATFDGRTLSQLGWITAALGLLMIVIGVRLAS